MKKIWRKNFEIQRVEFIMFSEIAEGFYKYQQPSVARRYVKEIIMIIEHGDNTATYFVKRELRKYIETVLRAIIDNPLRLKAIHDKTIKYNQTFFAKTRKIEKLQFAKLPDKTLFQLFNELFKLMQLSHAYSQATSWFVDADGEDLSNYLIKLIEKKIKDSKLKYNTPEVFSILTTPAEESLAQKEKKEMLGILSLILKDKQAHRLFRLEEAAIIEAGLKKINKNLVKKIFSHYKKWRWTPYTYIGPAYNLDYYLSIWSSLVRQGVKPADEIKKLAAVRQGTIKQRQKLLGNLKLSEKEKDIFNLAAQIVWLKAFRKDCLFYGMCVIDKILKELGRRQGLSLMQIKYITGQEMKNYKNFSADELNERYKFSVMYVRKGKIKIFTGQEAKDFLNKQAFEKVTIKKTKELKGTPAYVGQAKGKVKIINVPEDMVKMESGDIMVSHTTYPSLVPAMKKAAAIITDDGGITCHAAIVARELKTPCVVGTKLASKVLKDGDLVEVDANKGVVKRINIIK